MNQPTTKVGSYWFLANPLFDVQFFFWREEQSVADIESAVNFSEGEFSTEIENKGWGNADVSQFKQHSLLSKHHCV